MECQLRKHISVFCFLLLFIGINSGPAVAQKQDAWHKLSPGIDYRVFQLPDPNQVHVARMDRNNQDVTLESGLSWGYLGYGRETVRDISNRYDEALGYWGEKWGARNKVVVAINGYYFNQETGLPWRGQVQSGWYIKRFDNFENGSGIVWKLNGDIFIGGCVSHPPAKQLISFENNQTQKFDGINQERGKNDLIIYTPQFSETTGTNKNGIEILVEMEQPLLIRQNKSKIYGIVREIRDNQGSTPIPFNAIILSASGSARNTLLANVKVGQQIGISQQISHFKTDCKTPDSNDWSNAYTAIGGDFVFLEEGENNYFNTGSANVRAPRTAIAYNDQYVYFIVVDGRNPGIGIGMSMRDLAEFAKSNLNADWGIAEDSGGSSTMVIDGEVVNNTFCNFNDCEQQSILPPQPSPSSGLLPQVTTTTGLYDELARNYQTISESFVGNALMMVSVQPVLKSRSFKTNDPVRTVSNTDIRLGPGNNFYAIKSVPLYSNLVITSSLYELNGVYAKGEFWWHVSYGDTKGWVSETSLAGGIKPSNFTFIPKFYNYRKK